VDLIADQGVCQHRWFFVIVCVADAAVLVLLVQLDENSRVCRLARFIVTGRRVSLCRGVERLILFDRWKPWLSLWNTARLVARWPVPLTLSGARHVSFRRSSIARHSAGREAVGPDWYDCYW
jgi:hypothetical protein